MSSIEAMRLFVKILEVCALSLISLYHPILALQCYYVYACKLNQFISGGRSSVVIKSTRCWARNEGTYFAILVTAQFT